MQVMWTTRPLGKLHCISLRTRRVAISLAAVASLFVIVGVAVSVAAFKLAFEYDPALVANVGGVLTVSEAEKRESAYRRKLKELHDEVAAARQQIGQLHALKEEFARLAAPRGTRPAQSADRKGRPGQGGPQLALGPDDTYALTGGVETVAEDLASARLTLEQLNSDLNRMHTSWQRELLQLAHIPMSAPLADIRGLSSSYGVRLDPFTRVPSRHEGIDISAPAGTPILATAAGVVARVASDPQYGRMVDIDHGNGYLTRYAHALAIHVKPGQRLERGAVIGAVGSTGRSTAPHLHYEVRLENRPQNPLHYGLARE